MVHWEVSSFDSKNKCWIAVSGKRAHCIPASVILRVSSYLARFDQLKLRVSETRLSRVFSSYCFDHFTPGWRSCNIYKEVTREFPQLIERGKIVGQDILINGQQRPFGSRHNRNILWPVLQTALYDGETMSLKTIAMWRDWVLGPIGVSKLARALAQHSRRCWNFEGLLSSDNDCVVNSDAFGETWSILKPNLRYTAWPLASWLQSDGTRVFPGWPSDADMSAMYTDFIRGLRKHYRESGCVSWSPVYSYTVQLLRSCSNSSQLLNRSSFKAGLNKRISKGMCETLMLSFASSVAGSERFDVPHASLKPVSEVWQEKKRKSVHQTSDLRPPTFDVGDVCMIQGLRKAKHLNGHLVRVLGTKRRFDEEALLQSLETDKTLTVGRWPILRVLLRNRRMGKTSCFVEGWNSVAAWLTQQRQFNGSLLDIVNKLVLKTNGVACVGGDDEEFVDALKNRLSFLRPHFSTRYERRGSSAMVAARLLSNKKYLWGQPHLKLL